ncbi:FG-GAP repeat protein [Waterburya agarophytonicola K14]|uniref:FG-GAP repeat protein n=1 Tax=Waterburya agarophytonicola KI4 TaxID=2874699 RepID=A0A964BTV2_9CYAN|nr:calcium-binding protein [Waterburya agarophytonicola]MCC0177755.1 FG-GAP repeat protein [Waterburya agarophytonicola KI4]
MTNPTFDLSSLNGSNGFIISGISGADFSGSSVSGAGDVNADGIDDLIIGAFGANPNNNDSGTSYVVFGSNSGFSDSLPLSTLDGSNGFLINGIDLGDSSGLSVSSAGDVNADGIDDLIIGAPFASPNDNNASGESYVVFGNSEGFSSSLELSSLDGSNGFVINGVDPQDFSGSSVSSAGDLNADGIDDLIIGASSASVNENDAEGESYVVFGNSEGFSSSLELSSLDGNNGFVINGIDFADASGSSVSSAGDFNADGIDDLVIGANGADPNADDSGESYVVFGNSEGFGSNLELNSLDGSNGFVINGKEEFDSSGASVSHAGDINADGIDDIIIGANLASPNGINSAGESYVLFGSNEALSASLELSDLDGTNGFSLTGIDRNDNAGLSVSGAGDVNADGIDDIIIGAFYAAPNDLYRAGESYIVFGSNEGFSENIDLAALDGTNGYTLNGIDTNDNLGRSVSDAGDINADGIDDVIIGASGADSETRVNTGESYVVFGQTSNPVTEPLDQMIVGTSEDDVLFGGLGNDTIEGLEKNDYLEGREGNDLLDAGAGNDVLGGGEGRDSLLGYDGHDTLFGGSDNDTLKGGADRDNLFGGSDNDILIGNIGNDTLRGGGGKDFLKGGNDNDILFGNSADDTLHGGDGRDIFVFKGHIYGTDTIQDFNLGEDRIALGNGYNFESIEITGDVDSILSFNDSQFAIVQNVSSDRLSASNFIDM